MSPRSVSLLALFLAACSPVTAKVGEDRPGGPGPGDGGQDLPLDGGAETSDGGTTDTGGTPDGGAPDGGTPDGGTPDGGSTAEVDGDGDGVLPSQGDCDDSDPEIGPHVSEGDRADGIDQDCSGTADDLLVCGRGEADHRRIQDAIDAAPLDFVLRICPGEYEEDLELDRRLTLRSTDGAAVTTVRGSGNGPVLRITEVAEGPDGQLVGVEGLTLTGGQARRGGGLLAVQSDLQVLDCVLAGNQATSGGGAWLEGSRGTVQGTTFSDNSADEAGGLGAWGGWIEVRGCTFQGNSATATDDTVYGTGSGGGGMLLYGDGPVRDSTFDGNLSSLNGGGLYVLYGGGELEGNTFSGNQCGADGAGAYLNQASVTVSGNLFVGNQAADDAGGLRGYVCTATIKDNSFLSNVAADDAGGMKLSHSSNTISDNWFEGNQAGDAGGGLELDNDTSNVSDCTFVDNLAGRGGGLHSWRSEGPLTLEDLHFEGNQASGCGGALQLDNDPYLVTARRLTAWENSALDGGAVCTEAVAQDDGTIEDTRLVLAASLLVDNSASDDGGALFVRAGTVSLVNVTIADNAAAEGAVMLKDGSLDLRNTVVSGTTGSVALVREDGDLTLAYSNLHGNEAGVAIGLVDPTGTDGNLAVDPRFVDPAARDYDLESDSELVDAGDPTIHDTDGTRSDIGHTGGPHAH